ncbi:MAG: autotransporter domain-containing protein [Candidatus Omnitrophica bacterium]|nr:autotransporter domain-containing protein [Candidatus Omnitrophota bacterium]
MRKILCFLTALSMVGLSSSFSSAAEQNINFNPTFVGNGNFVYFSVPGTASVADGFNLAASGGTANVPAGVSANANGMASTVYFTGASSIAGSIGRNGDPISLMTLNGASKTVSLGTSSYITTTNFSETADGNSSLSLASGVNLNGKITNAVSDKGTLVLADGVHTVTGDIGSTGAGLHLVQVYTGSALFSGDVKATDFDFAGNGGNVSIAAGKSIITTNAISVSTDSASTIHYLGSTSISRDVGAAAGNKFAFIFFDGGSVTLGANLYTSNSSWLDAKTDINSSTVNLTGSRTIGGRLTLTNNGNIDVSNYTATVNGIYTQGSGSALKLAANSATDYGKIQTTNAAVVDSGSIVNVTVGGYIPNNAVMKIIDTGSLGIGSVPGTVTSSNARVRFLPSTSNNNLILTASRTATGYASLATTPDSNAAGTVLDNITNPSTDMTTILNTLDGLTNSQTANVLNTMVPYSSGFDLQVPVTQMEQFVGAQMDHLGGVLAMAFEDALPETGMSAGDQPSSYSTWFKAFGTAAHQDPRGTSQGYNVSNGGGAIGIEKSFSDNFKVGLAAGNSESWVRAKDNATRTEINSTQVSLYGGLKPVTSPWYLNGSLNYANGQYDSSREIHVSSSDNRIANADYRSDLYGAALESGYGIKAGNMILTPLASLAYNHLHLSKYGETNAGAMNLNIAAQDYDNLRAGVGTKIELNKNYSFGNLTPEIHAKYLYDIIADRQNIIASFAGGGTAFSVAGYKPARSGVNVGTSLTLATKKNVTLSLQYDLEMRQDYYAHTGFLNVSYKF